MFDAFNAKQKNDDYRKAYFISWLVNCQITKPIDYTVIADALWVTDEEQQEKLKQERDIVFKEFHIEDKMRGDSVNVNNK